MRVGFLQVYNEVDWIGEAIDQAMSLCDKLIIVEGSQFKKFRTIPTRSYDGTLQKISQKTEEYHGSIEVYDTIRKYDNYRKNQAANFNKALKMCKIGDYFLPFDADEFYFKNFNDKINELIEEGTTDYYYASGINLAFSFQWQIIFNGAPLSYSNIFFKKNKKLKFIPTHKPINHGSIKIEDNSGKCFIHYKWVKRTERMEMRFKTSGFYSQMFDWFKNYWDKIDLKDGNTYNFFEGNFSLKRYNGSHPQLLNSHPWYNLEDVREL